MRRVRATAGSHMVGGAWAKRETKTESALWMWENDVFRVRHTLSLSAPAIALTTILSLSPFFAALALFGVERFRFRRMVTASVEHALPFSVNREAAAYRLASGCSALSPLKFHRIQILYIWKKNIIKLKVDTKIIYNSNALLSSYIQYNTHTIRMYIDYYTHCIIRLVSFKLCIHRARSASVLSL